MWNDETPAAAEQGQYLPLEQTVGDDIAQIECPAPAQPLGPGQSARLRVSLPRRQRGGVREQPGFPLVYFDERRKPTLVGHVEGESAVYGHTAGGALLVLILFSSSTRPSAIFLDST